LTIKAMQQSIWTPYRRRQGILALALAIFLTPPGLASETPVSADIQRAAVQFLTELHRGEKGKIEITVGRLDRRLRLKTCGSSLAAFLPPKGRTVGNVTVGIRCPGPTTWQVYTSARVSITRDVIVAASHLRRGLGMAPETVAWSQRDLGTLYRGYLEDPTELKGMRLKRAVSAGTVINPSMLEPKPLVQRGDQVTLVVNAGSMEVSAAGEVMNEAAAGQLVRVRNLSSRRVVQGQLQQDRTVHVVR
jgi:flagella basal body P-ring formation protein FlgA